MKYLDNLIKQREKELKRMPAIDVKKIENESKNTIDEIIFQKLNKPIYERKSI